MSRQLSPVGIPARISQCQPFFYFDEETGYGFHQISPLLIERSPVDWKRAFPLGETVAMALLAVIKAGPDLPREVRTLDPDCSGLAGFIRDYRIAQAPEYFREGFYSVFLVVSEISIACPHLVPALGRLVSGLTCEVLEERALRCLLAAQNSAPLSVEEWAATAVPGFGELVEAEHQKGSAPSVLAISSSSPALEGARSTSSEEWSDSELAALAACAIGLEAELVEAEHQKGSAP